MKKAVSLRIQVGKKIEEILIEIRAQGSPIFAGLSLPDISLLASECVVEDFFVQNHYSEFQKGSLLMTTRICSIVKERSLFEDLLEDSNVSDSELKKFFKLGVVVLGLSLKAFPHLTTLTFDQRRGISLYFLNILLRGNTEVFNIGDIENANYMVANSESEGVVKIGELNWGIKNYFDTKNGKGASLLVIKDSSSWAEAAKRGLPACCSYAFMREFDKVLGMYYNWYAVEEMTLNPPYGWRVPTEEDFGSLLYTAQGDGLSLKREDQFQNKIKGINSSGFSALVGGYVYSDSGEFDYFGSYGGIWSSTISASDSSRASCLFMGPYEKGIELAAQDKGLGLNVRLLKDTSIYNNSKLNSSNNTLATNRQQSNSVGLIMFCPKCQMNLESNAKFCTDCGEPAISLDNTKKILMTTNEPDGFNENSNISADYKKGENKISNQKPYLYMIYGGLAFFILFAFIALIANNADILIVGAIGLWAILLAQVYIYVFIYQFWRFVINEGKKVGLSFEVETPGKAVGYLFIPLYNIFHWTFRVFREFPLEFNKVAEAKGYKVRMPLSPASNIPVWILVGIIPYVNIITLIVLFFISYPKFVKQGVDCINEFKVEKSGIKAKQ